MKRTLNLPEYVTDALSLPNISGFEAYVVGGSVRDLYMGLNPYDYDITTNAKPEEVIAVFANKYKVFDTGIKHGTVTVMYENSPIEITTYRIDGNYNDCRKPENVTFTPNLVDDLKRRDFTVNALVYDGEGEILDYFSGINDIEAGVIRSIGNPEHRFSEDALRILRALRFSAKLDFDIDADTSDAILSMCSFLKNISSERIFSELSTLFCYGNRVRLNNILTKYKTVIETALGLDITTSRYSDICGKSALVSCDNNLNFSYYLSSICSGNNQLFGVLKHLKASNAFAKQTVQLFEIHNRINEIKNLRDVKMLAKDYGVDFCLTAGEIFAKTNENFYI